MDKRMFFDKVVEMRRLQKEYFKTRSPFILEKSKAVERDIDNEIKRVQAIEMQRTQPNLFNQ